MQPSAHSTFTHLEFQLKVYFYTATMRASSTRDIHHFQNILMSGYLDIQILN